MTGSDVPQAGTGTPRPATSAGAAAGDDGGNRRRVRALIALGVVDLLLVALVGWLWWADQRGAQVAAARQEALQAAPGQAVAALSYDYRTLDRDLDRARAALTGDYLTEFEQRSPEVTAEARERRISTEAQVVASSVVRAEPDEVVVLLFANQTTRGADADSVQLTGARIELTLSRVGGRWLISEWNRL